MSTWIVVGVDRHDEVRRHERAAVEFEQVGSRVREHRHTLAPVGAIGVDDAKPDHLVHPERIGVVDRMSAERSVRISLGRSAVRDLGELDDTATVGGNP